MSRGRRVYEKRSADRKRKGYSYGDDGGDEDYVAEEEDSSSEAGSSEDAGDTSSSKIGYRKGRFSRRGGSRSSDDEDFSPDAEEGEEEFLVSGSRGRARPGGGKGGGKKKSSKDVKPKLKSRQRKVRRRIEAGFSGEDEGFIENDRVAVRMHRNGTKKVSCRTFMSNDRRVVVNKQRKRTQVRKNAISSKKMKKKSTVDPGTSDSDFVISDEDFVDRDRVMGPWPRKITGTSRNGLQAESKTRDDDVYVEEKCDLDVERVRNVRKPARVRIEKEKLKGVEKDADDLGKQVCGICLSEEQKGTIRGILNSCYHFFCLACIVEWSKVESRCPLCKKRFVTITKSSICDLVCPMKTTVIRVKKRNQVYHPTEEELRVLLDPYESIVCMECHLGGDDSLMLLCDICDSPAHTYCVGLGRDVPEGNWYCDCCRFAGEDSLQSQVHETRIAASSTVSNVSTEDTDSKILQESSTSQQLESSHGNAEDTPSRNLLRPKESLPEKSSSEGCDHDLPPINLMSEDNDVVSAPLISAAGGVSTLSGRRAIRQRIRTILSNRISRQTNKEPNMPENNLHNQAFASLEAPNLFASHSLEKISPIYQFPEHHLPKCSNLIHSSSSLVPCTFNEASKFRHVDGAKDQVQSIVKCHLKRLTHEKPLEHSTFKKLARSATHTVLAACGIEHRRSMVSSLPFRPLNNCIHDLDGGPANLARGCCSSCFYGYVKHVVKMMV